MTLSFTSLMTLLAVLPLAFVSHAILMRFTFIQKLPRQVSVFPAVGLASGVAMGGVFFQEGLSLEVTLFGLFVCLGISHVYFHIFNMGETARRIRILVGLKLGGKTELAANYDPRKAIEVRLERLIATRQVDLTANGFQSHTSLLLCAAILVHAYERLLFGHPAHQNSLPSGAETNAPA